MGRRCKTRFYMNIPYVRMYDKNGEFMNPIIGFYKSDFPNRKQRREKIKRFRGNKKGISLSVVKTQKYKRVMQLIQIIEKDKKGNPIQQTVENNHIKRNVINHYF